MQIDVGVAAQAPLLHVAVRDFEIREQQPQFFEIAFGLGGSPQVGLRDDFEERSAGPVEIDLAVGPLPRFVVHIFSGVLFEMRADDPDLAFRGRFGLGVDFEPAVVADGKVVLADLIALGKIGIIILFAVPLGERGDVAVQGDGRFDRQLKKAVPFRDR